MKIWAILIHVPARTLEWVRRIPGLAHCPDEILDEGPVEVRQALPLLGVRAGLHDARLVLQHGRAAEPSGHLARVCQLLGIAGTKLFEAPLPAIAKCHRPAWKKRGFEKGSWMKKFWCGRKGRVEKWSGHGWSGGFKDMGEVIFLVASRGHLTSLNYHA